jgi:hypothetical protein
VARELRVRAPSRPTLYKGILMRSRLEADYARHLDQERDPLPWLYEPQCFASERGQYLPDFQIDPDTQPWYVEVKPFGLTVAQIDQALDRMTILWSSNPNAMLELVLWRYQADEAPLELKTCLSWPDIKAGRWRT